ncbi:hypothetical protein [Phytomonospora endophytica]|uniref:Putative integral membrane protein n=1 Tax=Phytomonospora endophytica TaxID=714109 RepID=A0A841FMB7_9ACTN|nr:hypothetical protein [Phytomonospora endophytica]MBB6033090.1 putative integral membrane protein [Phytomonospora endophytica]GIG65317.1 hypothetical protein Pen01_16120 [Phytomonospora endophytica]
MSLPSRPPSARSLWPLVIALLGLVIVGTAVAALVWALTGHVA